MNVCRVPGCNRSRRSPRSTMCEAHRQRWRRHGDPKQATINQKELKPYIRYAEKLIRRNTSGKIEEALSRLKVILEASSKDTVADFYERGRAMRVFDVKASNEILRVLASTDVTKPAVVIAAMFLLSLDQPHRFVSDRGFIFQLVRAFRSLSAVNVGSYYNHKTGKVHRAYKDMSPKVVETIGDVLVEHYNSWAARVVGRYRDERSQMEQTKKLLNEGFYSISEATQRRA